MSSEHAFAVDVVLAGATGALGSRIAQQLRKRDARVTAIVRRGTAGERSDRLRDIGVTVAELDVGSVAELTAACAGAACVVSALNGLRGAVMETQATLLAGAVAAGVPRFIPSDFSLDFTQTVPGANRNLDLRREFHALLDATPIQSTSILNGAFMELLTGQAPFILFQFKRVLYWGNADQLLDFTTMDDVAAFTAVAALDATTPRFLRIAGDQISARGLAAAAAEATGTPFRVFRAGNLERLAMLIRFIRFVAPAREEVFPPWQGMQYMRDMFAGRGKLAPLDNGRYPKLTWTSVREMLAER